MTLLTAEQFHDYVPDVGDVTDAALDVMLAANERAIVRRVGPLDTVEETIYAAGRSLLPLGSEPDTITTVTDYTDYTGSTATTLTADDYRMRGMSLEKVSGYWGSRTHVKYVPVDDTNERIVVLVQLMKCDLNYEPGMSSQAGGGAQESYTSDHIAERERILDRLGQPELFA
jgi:hypothetical protein